MAKLTLSDVSNLLGNPTSAANTINANSSLTEVALENTLSRDGTSPNQMNADLDMNNHSILNVDTITADHVVVDGFELSDAVQEVSEARDEAVAAAEAAEAAEQTVINTVDGVFPNSQRFAVGASIQSVDLGNPLIPKEALSIYLDGAYQFSDTYDVTSGVITPVSGTTWDGDGIRENMEVKIVSAANITVAEAIPVNNSVSLPKLDTNLSSIVNIAKISAFPANRTELKALDTTVHLCAWLRESGREGMFYLRNYSDFNSISIWGIPYANLVGLDTYEGYIIRSTFDTSKVWVRDIQVTGLNVNHFGAVPYKTEAECLVGQTSAAQIQIAWYVAQYLRVPLYLNGVYYRCETQLYLRLRRSGSALIGPDTGTLNKLYFRADTVAEPNVYIWYDDNSDGGSNAFDHRFRNMRIEGNLNGVCVKVGDNTADGQGGDINTSVFDSFDCINYNGGSNAVSLETNWTFHCRFQDCQINGPAKTYNNICWRRNGFFFCKTSKCTTGGGLVGIVFKNGYHIGWHDDCLDMEELQYCYSSETANNYRGLISGGTWVYATHAWRQTLGGKIIARAVNSSSQNTSYPASDQASAVFDPTYGVGCVRCYDMLYAPTPAVPSSETWHTNDTGVKVRVIISGGTSVYLWRPGASAGQSITGGGEALLDIGEQIRLDYSSAPSWVWTAWS